LLAPRAGPFWPGHMVTPPMCPRLLACDLGADRAQGRGMNEGLNTVTLFGNLGADPELKQTAKGAVLKFNLATNEVWFDKEKQEKQSRVQWHRVTIFGRRAEGLAKFLTKGMQVLVQGKLSTSSFEKEGQKHYRTEIIANDIHFGHGGRSNGAFVPPQTVATALVADAPF
jgi:single stranded DNA-binding protein